MSRSFARLKSSTRSIPLVRPGSVIAPRYNHSTTSRQRNLASNSDGTKHIAPHHIPPAIVSNKEKSESTLSPEDEEVLDSRFSRHLNQQFAPLKFPPLLAKRILTHGSHSKSVEDGHNARLGFIGTCQPYLIPFNQLII
jgi:hypothetical protein